MKTKFYDAIIIGLGPSAIMAAVILKRLNRNIVIIGKKNSQLAYSGIVENYLGFNNISGFKLYQLFLKNLEYNNIQIIEKYVEEISKNKIILKNNMNLIQIKTDNEIFLSKTILIATGTKYKKLNLINEIKFENRGIYNCAICDGALFYKKNVIVIGGGNTAMDSALFLSQICKKIYLVNKNQKFKGEFSLFKQIKERNNINVIYNALTDKILHEKNKIQGIRYINLLNNKKYNINNISGIFVNIGMNPTTNFLNQNSCIIKLNSYGEIIINKKFQTNIQNVFSAGDVCDSKFNQNSIAVGEGCKAALFMNQLLNKFD